MSSSILAQCIGMISMTLLFVTYQINDRKKILLCQVCISLCWVVHYGLLGAPLQTAALWMKSPRRIRQFMLMASPLWLIYDA